MDLARRALDWQNGLGLVAVTVVLFGLVDVLTAEPKRIRQLNRHLWAVLAFVPVAGVAAWFAFGRPVGSTRPGQGMRPGRRPKGAIATVTPLRPMTRLEEMNAELARSEELNRKLEQWEAEQHNARRRRRDQPHERSAPPGDRPVDSVDGSAQPADAEPPVRPRPSEPVAEVRPDDPRRADLSAWDADLRRWEEELRDDG